MTDRARERMERAYAEALGVRALDRQRQAAAERWVCCGELSAGPHHFACPRYEPPDGTAVHEDQGALL